MLFHDEVRSEKSVPTGGKKPTKKQVDNAVAMIEELSTDWDPGAYTDCYRQRLKQVIEKKRKRRKIEVPEPENEPRPVPDLMEALERSLKTVRGGGDAAAARNAGSGSDDGEELDDLDRDELYARAKREQIPGRSKMGRKELVAALKDA